MEQKPVVGDDVVVFKPRLRKIDLASAEGFSASLSALLGEGAKLVLDLSEVQFIDSSGLGKIVSALRRVRERSGDLRICGAQEPVKMLFSMVRLSEIVGIDADVQASTLELRRGAGGAPCASS